MKLILICSFLLFLPVYAGPLDETRCCVEPVRNADGTIRRRADVRREFRKRWPCPSTGLTTGACPDWSMDHVISLACGGRDEVSNLQWLPNSIKSGKDADNKDRWERRVYCPG